MVSLNTLSVCCGNVVHTNSIVLTVERLAKTVWACAGETLSMFFISMMRFLLSRFVSFHSNNMGIFQEYY